MTVDAKPPRESVTVDSPWTLDRLVWPVPVVRFIELLATRTPMRFPDVDADTWSSLLSWETIREVLHASDIPAARVVVTRDGSPVMPDFFCSQGKVQAARLFDLLDRGYSMIIRRLEECHPPMAALSAHLQTVLGDRIRIALVSTTGAGGALQRHYDRGDVLALQLEGAKRWKLYDQPVDNPVMAGPAVDRSDEGVVEIDTVLNPGDRLFVPAGYWHRCENQGERSVHLSIVFNPVCAQSVLSALARAMVLDPACRRPTSRLLDPADRAASVRELQSTLVQRLRSMSVEEMMAAYFSDVDRGGSY